MVNKYSYVLKYAILIIGIMKEKQQNNLFEIEWTILASKSPGPQRS